MLHIQLPGMAHNLLLLRPCHFCGTLTILYPRPLPSQAVSGGRVLLQHCVLMKTLTENPVLIGALSAEVVL